MMKKKRKTILSCVMAFMIATAGVFVPISTTSVYAADPASASQSFDEWLVGFRADALDEGISPELLDEAFRDVELQAKVIESDRNQPTKKWTFAEYKQKIVHPIRISEGQKMIRQHRDLLNQISQQYGVPAEYIVALWGVETSYGKITGGHYLIEALATLAWDGRRGEFFRKELMLALKIAQDGHISVRDMKGSWAGAMGQNQFMPSSFHAYAADGDGDGKKDIWNNLADVFASTANYLAKSGWREDERWGREVSIPSSVTKDMIENKEKKTLAEWKQMGVTLPDGSDIPVVTGMKAYIVAPDGITGPTYFAYHNYSVIMKWNRSTYFATSVGLIADRLAPFK